MKAKSINGKGKRKIETVLAESMADGYKPELVLSVRVLHQQKE